MDVEMDDCDTESPALAPLSLPDPQEEHSAELSPPGVSNLSSPTTPPPIDMLPDDVLSSIFLLARDENSDDSDQSPYESCITTPLAISRTCSRWRQLALDTPLLWSKIVVPVHNYDPHILAVSGPTAYERRESWNLKTTSVFLECSGTCPLGVTFLPSESNRPDDAIYYFERCTDLLLKVAGRWKIFVFGLTDRGLGSSLFRLLRVNPDSLPMLDSLDVNVDFSLPDNVDEGSAEEWRILGRSMVSSFSTLRAPSLRSLRLDFSWALAVDLKLLPVSWKTLENLDVELFTGTQGVPLLESDLLGILQKCENLRKLKFFAHDSAKAARVQATAAQHVMQPALQPLEPIVFDQDPPRTPTDCHVRGLPRISLPYLESLALSGNLVHKVLSSHMDLPCLHSLSILRNQVDDFGAVPRDRDGITDWLETYGKQLESVKFDHGTLTSSGMLRCLSLLPNVRELYLVDHLFSMQVEVRDLWQEDGGDQIDWPEDLEDRIDRLYDARLASASAAHLRKAVRFLTPLWDMDKASKKMRLIGEVYCPKLDVLKCFACPGVAKGLEGDVERLKAARNFAAEHGYRTDHAVARISDATFEPVKEMCDYCRAHGLCKE